MNGQGRHNALLRKRAKVTQCPITDCKNFRDHPLHRGEGLHPGQERSDFHYPVGFLLSSILKCFKGETFERWRERERLAEEYRLEEQRRHKEENLASLTWMIEYSKRPSIIRKQAIKIGDVPSSFWLTIQRPRMRDCRWGCVNGGVEER